MATKKLINVHTKFDGKILLRINSYGNRALREEFWRGQSNGCGLAESVSSLHGWCSHSLKGAFYQCITEAQCANGLTSSCFLVRNYCSWEAFTQPYPDFAGTLHSENGIHASHRTEWIIVGLRAASCDLLIQSFDVGQFFPESCCNRRTGGVCNRFMNECIPICCPARVITPLRHPDVSMSSPLICAHFDLFIIYQIT